MLFSLRWRQLKQLLASRSLWWGVAIFVVALTLRYAWLAYLDPPPIVDGWSYYYSAETLASGDGYKSPFTHSYTAGLPPGYPLALSGVLVVFGADPMVAKVFNVVVGAATAVVVYALAMKIRDRRTGIAAGLVLAFFPSQIYFVIMTMTETFFAGLAALLVLLLVLWVADGGMKAWQVFALGLLLGFMSLTRAEALLLLPAMALLMAVLWRVAGRRWLYVGQYLLVLIAGVTLFIGPWTIRNYARFDELIIIRGSQDSPARLLRLGLSADFDSPRYTIAESPRAEPEPLGELLAYYGEQPWQLARLGADKIAALFGRDYAFYWVPHPYGPPHFTPEVAARWAVLGDAYYYVVGLAAMFGVLSWVFRRDPRLLVVIWFLASWSLVHLLFVPQPRYHFPIIPMVALLAGVGAIEVWDRIRRPAVPAAAELRAPADPPDVKE